MAHGLRARRLQSGLASGLQLLGAAAAAGETVSQAARAARGFWTRWERGASGCRVHTR